MEGTRSGDSALQGEIRDPNNFIHLYGTTPPRTGSSDAIVESIAEKFAMRMRGLPLRGIVVYDIQDETGRTEAPRPFAFAGTIDPRKYARVLARRASLETITYKSVGAMSEDEWHAWLDETSREFGAGCLSIVGRPTSGVRYPLSLTTAIRLAAAHPAGFLVGGVVIPERHTEQRSESARMLSKTEAGCSYFISQTVYNADATIRLLSDYVQDCRDAGTRPRRIVLTFAPAGRAKTIAFLKWLGVHIPRDTERAISEAADPIARSVETCCENLRRILENEAASHVPLGINVESVSINRDEIDASVDLFRALDAVWRERS